MSILCAVIGGSCIGLAISLLAASLVVQLILTLILCFLWGAFCAEFID